MIGILPAREVLSGVLSRCEACGLRRPYEGRRWCKPCILRWQRNAQRAGRRYSGTIPDPSPTLDGIIPPHYARAELSDLPESLVETFLALADEKGLFLWGEPGRGKTYASCAFLKHLWAAGWDISRINYEMLSLQIRDSYRVGSAISELDVLRPFLTISKLVIEDAGANISAGCQESDFGLRTFLLLLDTRLEQGLATFMTGNKSVEELGRSFDQRVASRIRQACEVVQIRGRDKRDNG